MHRSRLELLLAQGAQNLRRERAARVQRDAPAPAPFQFVSEASSRLCNRIVRRCDENDVGWLQARELRD
jgi:hypothetical protein